MNAPRIKQPVGETAKKVPPLIARLLRGWDGKGLAIKEKRTFLRPLSLMAFMAWPLLKELFCGFPRVTVLQPGLYVVYVTKRLLKHV